jgi:hypothetical protein
MQRLESLAKNKTVIYKLDGTKILYSYSTPVAIFTKGEYLISKDYLNYSKTTKRHINSWVTPLVNQRHVSDSVIHSFL